MFLRILRMFKLISIFECAYMNEAEKSDGEISHKRLWIKIINIERKYENRKRLHGYIDLRFKVR